MNDGEKILNWNDTCRFRFVNYKELGLNSHSDIRCFTPENVQYEAIQKKNYLIAIIAAASEAYGENELIVKHIAYSAAQELSDTSDYEWGCLCPFTSCISKPESGLPIVLDDYNYLDIKCDCVENSKPSQTQNDTTDYFNPTNGRSSFFKAADIKGCTCAENRKNYLDPITFQWYCICDEQNEDCEDVSTPPTWTFPDYWTHPEIPTISTILPTRPPIPESCNDFHWTHVVNGNCVCLDSSIQWMGNDGHCYCKVFNIQAHPTWCYIAHVALGTACALAFFCFFGE